MTPERKAVLSKALAKRQQDITIVLENVFDPHNVSAVMRTCDAVGVQEIFILNTNIPRHKRWGFRSSSGAKKWLTVHEFENFEECLTAIRKKYTTILTTHLSDDAVNLYEIDFKQSIALVFGNEQDGVSPEMLAAADGNFIIPQVGIIKSLNISVACAVTLYEAYRQKELAGHYERNNMPIETKTQLMDHWEFANLREKLIKKETKKLL
jgi:tRNA (guanosine-2'-O-)-methyltransferase